MVRGMKLCLFLVVLIGLALTPAAVAADDKFNEKFTFEDETFANPDGTVTENGVIEAGSKKTGGGSTFTVCSYFSEGYGEFLGQFESADFASDDPAEVRAFCLANAANRQ